MVIIDLPPVKVLIGCRWVCKVKYNATGEVERYKSRLVAKGYSENPGVDYSDTFLLIAKMVTVRSFISLVVSKHWFIF